MSTQENEKNNISFKYAALAMKFRWFILAFITVATILAALQIKYVDIRNDPDTFLPPSNRYVSTNTYIEDTFGMGNIFVVGIELKDGQGDVYQPWFVNLVREMHIQLEEMEFAIKPNFISVAAQKVKNMGVTEDGSLLFRRLIPNSGIDTKDATLSKEQLDFMRAGIDSNPVLKPMIIDERDPVTGKKCFNNEAGCVAKATFIIADFDNGVKQNYVKWVQQVAKIVEPYTQDDRIRVSIAGEPYFLAWMMVQLIEHWYLFVASILIALGILYMETRTWRGALFPMIGVGISIVWTLGLMGFSRFQLTTMMVLTPMLILAVGMGHAIQVTRRYMRSLREGDNNEEASFNALGHTIIPATLSIVTDAIGFATLATVDISFYKAYAYFGMFGMFSLLMTTTTLIPLMMVLFPNKSSTTVPEGYAWERSMGNTITTMLTGFGKYIPLAVVAVILVMSTNYTKISDGISNMLNDGSDRSITEKLSIASRGDRYDIMPGVEKGINYAEAAFKSTSKPIQDIYQLNKIMPGVISFNIPIRSKAELRPECDMDYLPKGCYDPDEDSPQGILNKSAVLAAMEKMEDDIRKHPYIGFTASYAQYVKIANMLLMTEPGDRPSLNDFKVPTTEYLLSKDAEDDRSPDDIVSMYNGLLEMASSPGDLASMTDQAFNAGVIMGFINTMDPVKTHEVLLFLQEYVEKHKNDKGFELVNFGYRNADETGDKGEVANDTSTVYLSPGIGGFLGATEATRVVTFDNWVMNPLGTALAIFIVVSLIFRSLLVSSLLMVILGITLFAQYGLAGYLSAVGNWSGNLHFGNLVTLSIAMGLGVDYSIYMISRLREEFSLHKDWAKALNNTITTTGSSVVISVVVLLGSFIPLMATDLGNTWGLSVYISEAIIIDVFTSLTLLPLMIYWFKPKYVFDTNS